MSKRKIVYYMDHNSVKVDKILKAYKMKDKRLYKEVDHKTLVDLVLHLIENIQKKSVTKDEYDLDDFQIEEGELEFYIHKLDKPCLNRTEFASARESYYADFKKFK